MNAEEGLDQIDAAMLRFSGSGDAATLVDEIADILTACRTQPEPPRVHTQEENIAFRKDWDRRYAEGQQRAQEGR